MKKEAATEEAASEEAVVAAEAVTEEATIKSARLPTHSFTCTPLSLHVGRRRLDRLGQGVSASGEARHGGEGLARCGASQSLNY